MSDGGDSDLPTASFDGNEPRPDGGLSTRLADTRVFERAPYNYGYPSFPRASRIIISRAEDGNTPPYIPPPPPPHRYWPLRNSSDIRVLQFCRPRHDDSDSKLRCRLTAVSLEYPPSYTALSYAWGQTFDDDRHLTHEIFIDDGILKVTPTLHQALIRLRRWFGVGEEGDESCSAMAVWADAICIDQRNITERQSQVLLMSEIYRKADSLTVWLGDMRSGPALIATHQSERDAMLERALNNAWFQRRWIIQEFLLSNVESRYVHVGPEMFTWAHFSSMASQWRSLGGSKHQSLAVIWSLDTSSIKGDFEYSLIQNLRRYDSAECADARDRIYALRSLSTDAQQLPVSYSCTVEELYIDVAQLCATFHLEALLLSALLRPNKPGVRRTLPTWVPDWRLPISPDYYNSYEHKDAVEYIINKASTENVGATSGIYDPTDASFAVEGWLLDPCKPSSLTDVECPTCRVRKEMWEADGSNLLPGHKRRKKGVASPPQRKHNDELALELSERLFVFEGSRFAFLLQVPDHDLSTMVSGRQYFEVIRSYHFRDYTSSARAKGIWRGGLSFADLLGEANRQTVYLM